MNNTNGVLALNSKSDGTPKIMNQLLAEICLERRLDYREFCAGWLVQISASNRHAHVLGFNFPLNSATASRIAEDKVATFECLDAHRVPAVEHRLFLSPALKGWVSETSSSWSALQDAFACFGGDAVVKENSGTGGVNVIRARSPREIEAAALRLFSKFHAVAVSPFLCIEDEFRAYVAPVNGITEVVMIYSKVRGRVVGDGFSTVRTLHASAATAGELQAGFGGGAILQATGQPFGYDDVPLAGASVILHWKHNLGQGAQPHLHLVHDAIDQGLVTTPHRATSVVVRLAQEAARSIDLHLGAVDVVSTQRDGGVEFRVLEINAGVMLESFSSLSDRHRVTAKAVYALAIKESLR